MEQQLPAVVGELQFPEDREAPELDCEVVQVRLSELTLHAPRQWGACWLALTLWERLELDRFWGPRLPANREGTRWLDILKVQVCYRLSRASPAPPAPTSTPSTSPSSMSPLLFFTLPRGFPTAIRWFVP